MINLSNKNNKLNKLTLESLNYFNNSKLIQYSLFIFFAFISFFLLLGHTLYRDDARPLLIATYNHTFSDLYTAMRYDGGPMMYHLLLWFTAKFVHLSPFLIKIIHFSSLILILICLIFLIKIPNIYRALILFQTPYIGYSLYVRRYSTIVLLLFLFTYFYLKKEKREVWLFITLFLLSQTSPHGLLIAIGLFMFTALNIFNEKKEFFKAYYLIPLCGFALSALQLIPPADLLQIGTEGLKPLFSEQSLDFLINYICDVFLNNFFIGFAFFYMICIASIKNAKEKPFLIGNFVFCLIFLFITFLLVGALKLPTLNRHHWLLSYTVISLLIIINHPFKFKITNVTFVQYFFITMTFCSAINFISFIPKAKVLYSNGETVAKYLDKHYPENTLLTKYEFFIEPIIVYRKNWTPYFSLERQKFVNYVVCNHTSADFTRFKNLITVLRFSELVNDLNNTPDRLLEKAPIIVLSSHVYEKDINLENVRIKGKYSLKFLADFNGAKYDNYILYRVEGM